MLCNGKNKEKIMNKKDFYTDRIIGSNRIIAIPTNNSISVNAVLFD